MVIQFDAEEHPANVHNVNLAQQRAGTVGDGEHATVAAAHLVDNLAQLHIRTHGHIVAVDDGVQVHQRQCCMVGVMGQQPSLLGQSRTVDTVRLEDDNREVGRHGDYHQR